MTDIRLMGVGEPRDGASAALASGGRYWDAGTFSGSSVGPRRRAAFWRPVTPPTQTRSDKRRFGYLPPFARSERPVTYRFGLGARKLTACSRLRK